MTRDEIVRMIADKTYASLGLPVIDSRTSFVNLGVTKEGLLSIYRDVCKAANATPIPGGEACDSVAEMVETIEEFMSSDIEVSQADSH